MTAAALPFSLNAESGRLHGARFVSSPNCDQRPAGMAIDALIIHAISLPPGCYGGNFIERFFCNQLSAEAHPSFADIHGMRVSAHFLIKRGGALLQFVPVHLRAWHAGKSEFRGRPQVNDFSLGIELEGCDADLFEESQYATLTKLTRVLQGGFPAIANDRIVGHSDISPGRKTDPGPGFDWARFISP